MVAEGVETQDQYDQLRNLGCSKGQGYLMHRPAAPETIGDLLRSHAVPAAPGH